MSNNCVTECIKFSMSLKKITAEASQGRLLSLLFSGTHGRPLWPVQITLHSSAGSISGDVALQKKRSQRLNYSRLAPVIGFVRSRYSNLSGKDDHTGGCIIRVAVEIYYSH